MTKTLTKKRGIPFLGWINEFWLDGRTDGKRVCVFWRPCGVSCQQGVRWNIRHGGGWHKATTKCGAGGLVWDLFLFFTTLKYTTARLFSGKGLCRI